MSGVIDDDADRLGEECDNCGKPNATCDCTAADWTRECEVCGQTPVVNMTGMCGPCTFGEADTIGGNW